MASSEYIPTVSCQELATAGKLCFEIDDHFVVLVQIGSDIFCLDDVCTHDGGPLGEGELEDHCLICPRHGAKFDIRTGEALTMPATEPTRVHDVKIEAGKVWVRLRTT